MYGYSQGGDDTTMIIMVMIIFCCSIFCVGIYYYIENEDDDDVVDPCNDLTTQTLCSTLPTCTWDTTTFLCRTTPVSPVTCTLEQHVSSKVCVPCPKFGTNLGFRLKSATAAPASGADTSCTVKQPCPENWHVNNGSCEACPAGKINDAGDDPNDSNNTECQRPACTSTQYMVCPPTPLPPAAQCTFTPGDENSCTSKPGCSYTAPVAASGSDEAVPEACVPDDQCNCVDCPANTSVCSDRISPDASTASTEESSVCQDVCVTRDEGTLCELGYYVNSNHVCMLCPKWEHASGNVSPTLKQKARSLYVGTYARHHSSIPSTSCATIPIPCDEGNKSNPGSASSGGFCSPCPPGATNDGPFISIDPTYQVCNKCMADHYVTADGNCVKCGGVCLQSNGDILGHLTTEDQCLEAGNCNIDGIDTKAECEAYKCSTVPESCGPDVVAVAEVAESCGEDVGDLDCANAPVGDGGNACPDGCTYMPAVTCTGAVDGVWTSTHQWINKVNYLQDGPFNKGDYPSGQDSSVCKTLCNENQEVVCTRTGDSSTTGSPESCEDTVADCMTGYTPGSGEGPSTTCPAGCTLTPAVAAGGPGARRGEGTVADCMTGYTPGSGEVPSTTCPEGCTLTPAVAEENPWTCRCNSCEENSAPSAPPNRYIEDYVDQVPLGEASPYVIPETSCINECEGPLDNKLSRLEGLLLECTAENIGSGACIVEDFQREKAELNRLRDTCSTRSELYGSIDNIIVRLDHLISISPCQPNQRRLSADQGIGCETCGLDNNNPPRQKLGIYPEGMSFRGPQNSAKDMTEPEPYAVGGTPPPTVCKALPCMPEESLSPGADGLWRCVPCRHGWRGTPDDGNGKHYTSPDDAQSGDETKCSDPNAQSCGDIHESVRAAHCPDNTHFVNEQADLQKKCTTNPCSDGTTFIVSGDDEICCKSNETCGNDAVVASGTVGVPVEVEVDGVDQTAIILEDDGLATEASFYLDKIITIKKPNGDVQRGVIKNYIENYIFNVEGIEITIENIPNESTYVIYDATGSVGGTFDPLHAQRVGGGQGTNKCPDNYKLNKDQIDHACYNHPCDRAGWRDQATCCTLDEAGIEAAEAEERLINELIAADLIEEAARGESNPYRGCCGNFNGLDGLD